LDKHSKFSKDKSTKKVFFHFFVLLKQILICLSPPLFAYFNLTSPKMFKRFMEDSSKDVLKLLLTIVNDVFL
jgi:hypothetical protein